MTTCARCCSVCHEGDAMCRTTVKHRRCFDEKKNPLHKHARNITTTHSRTHSPAQQQQQRRRQRRRQNTHSNKICKKLFGVECDELATVVAPLGPFYRGEEYHQKYFAKHGGRWCVWLPVCSVCLPVCLPLNGAAPGEWCLPGCLPTV
jgi:hypothetical protein